MAHIEDRTYVIVNISGLTEVDFTQVMETAASTVRKSLDGAMFTLKFEHDVPQTIIDLDNNGYLIEVGGIKYFNHPEILEIVNGPDWNSPDVV